MAFAVCAHHQSRSERARWQYRVKTGLNGWRIINQNEAEKIERNHSHLNMEILEQMFHKTRVTNGQEITPENAANY